MALGFENRVGNTAKDMTDECIDSVKDGGGSASELAGGTSVGGEVEAGESAGNGTEGVSQPLDELRVLTERYTRLLADFDNFRKRQTRERVELIKRANSDLLCDLLPVIDNLELALDKAAEPDDPFVTGIRLVYEQLLGTLDKYGMIRLHVEGEPFDPEFHEALSHVSSDSAPDHTIIEQYRSGWLLSGKLLRAAQVIVSSGPETEGAR